MLALARNYRLAIKTVLRGSASVENMTVTPKIHIVEHHLIDFFNQLNENKHGLGWFSEQSFEAMHHDMMEEWNTHHYLLYMFLDRFEPLVRGRNHQVNGQPRLPSHPRYKRSLSCS